jgi:WD40 repeat protein/serine/threonine protein kinase
MEETKSLLRDLFNEAAEILDPAERTAFLDSVCVGDRALRTKLERLLHAASNAGNFLREPENVRSEKIGERIGRYRLLNEIGRGGCGVVYLAEQEEPVRRRVALKVIKLGMDTRSVVARFEAERQALALMEHPNIARVFDAGATATGRPYFVMELVTGLRITEHAEQRQLSIRQRLELFIGICHAVQHAHQKGIIHRDLKPSNILVMEQEGVAVPKVIDFGIAKATEQGFDDAVTATAPEQFVGTPAYMSPEQVEPGKRDIDTRSDIYSLGVILYELLAGRPPFDSKKFADAGLEEMRRLIREVDPPRPSTTTTRNLDSSPLPAAASFSRERLAAVRGDLDWIVMKCLEKDRTRRYATANAVASDIRRHLDHEPVSARPPSGIYRLQKVARRHRLAFGAALSVACILILGVIVSSQLALRATRAERDQHRLRDLAEANVAESRQLLIRRYVAEGNRLIETGQPTLGLSWLVEALQLETGDPVREADERLRIAQSLVGAPELRFNLLQGRTVRCVALSSNGDCVVTGSDNGIVRVSNVNDGGEAGINLALPGEVGSVCLAPDGSRVAAASLNGQARVWNAITGEALTPPLQAGDFDPTVAADEKSELTPSIHFSPDGKFLLLAWGSKSAQLRDAFTGDLLRQFTHDEVVYHAAFSPDGQWIVTSSKDGSARIWETATGKSACPPLQHTGAVYSAEFSADGKKLLTIRDHHFVQLWDWREARRLAPEIPRRSHIYRASLSPDGSTILTTSWSGFAHLYDAASSRLMRQFQQQGGLVDATFSPDGNFLVTACEDGNAWLWNVDDATDHPIPLPQGGHIEEIVFSRDGRRLAVASQGGRARVWELFPAERGVRRLAGSTVSRAEFDHTGRRALLLSIGAKEELAIYDVAAGKLLGAVPISASKVERVEFSPDDRCVLVLGLSSLRILDSDSGGEIFPPLSVEAPVSEAVWSPDGKRVLTAGEAGIRAWDASTGKPALTFASSASAKVIAISPDGTRLASGHDDNTVQFWNAATGDKAGSPLSMREAIHQIAFSPDGKRFAISTDVLDGEAKVEIRDVSSGKVLGTPLAHRGNVASFVFSRDGLWLATACEDHLARVWNGMTGAPVSPWLPQDFEGRQVAFSPDGRRLATLARRGMVRLWNAQTGEPLGPPMLYRRNEGSGWVSYSPDGQRLLLARGGDEAWLRELKPETASVEQLRFLAQALSCTRFDPAAGMMPIDDASLDRAWKQLGERLKAKF